MPRRDANYICSSIIRIESVYFKLKGQRYYPQVILKGIKIRPNNNASRLGESDESDNMSDESRDELKSNYESNNDNNESKKFWLIC